MLSARRGFVIHRRDAAKHLAGQTGHQIGTEHLAGESLFGPMLSGRTSPHLGIVIMTKSALVRTHRKTFITDGSWVRSQRRKQQTGCCWPGVFGAIEVSRKSPACGDSHQTRAQVKGAPRKCIWIAIAPIRLQWEKQPQRQQKFPYVKTSPAWRRVGGE